MKSWDPHVVRWVVLVGCAVSALVGVAQRDALQTTVFASGGFAMWFMKPRPEGR